MSKRELKNHMQAIRSIYSGITDAWEAYRKALVYVNRNVDFGKASEWLHHYNNEVYKARAI